MIVRFGKRGDGRGRSLLGLGICLALAGCNALGTSGRSGGSTTQAGEFQDGNQDPTVTSPAGRARGEPNDGFEQALVTVFDQFGNGLLQGTIAVDGDVDVFSLGPMQPGDRISVSTDTQDSPLDVSIALFDDQGRLFVTNDDRDLSSGVLDAFVQETIRHAGDPYYLVVSASPFAVDPEQATGSYRAGVSVTRGQQVPEPQGQTLLLDFDGGTLDIRTIPVEVVVPFDTGSISPIYAGQTQTVKAAIVDTMWENFEGLDVTIVTTDDDALPPPGTYSTVFFGGFNFLAFGISETVDSYNQDPSDVSVIFTESFQPELFSTTPTPEELGRAIGNIAAHEAGHLLGLNHVNDPEALMDEANPADTFLADQEFKEAPLSPSIAPLGTQDALLLLAEILGIL